jgi:hypothetical protein
MQAAAHLVPYAALLDLDVSSSATRTLSMSKPNRLQVMLVASNSRHILHSTLTHGSMQVTSQSREIAWLSGGLGDWVRAHHTRPDNYWLKTSPNGPYSFCAAPPLLENAYLLPKQLYLQSACICLTYHLRLQSFPVVTILVPDSNNWRCEACHEACSSQVCC